MMFNETNRMICADVDITDYYNIIRKEGIESFMLTLYTPEREDGQPKGVANFVHQSWKCLFVMIQVMVSEHILRILW